MLKWKPPTKLAKSVCKNCLLATYTGREYIEKERKFEYNWDRDNVQCPQEWGVFVRPRMTGTYYDPPEHCQRKWEHEVLAQKAVAREVKADTDTDAQ